MRSFRNKRVLVFGLGLNQGGVGSARFFATQGAKVRVTDLKLKSLLKPSLDALRKFPDIEYTLGEHKYEDIDWAELIIKNPAVKPGNKYLEYAAEKGKKIETDMGIFLQSVKPSQIIGITGTKGKSTTSSLVYEILKKGKNILLAGNIGKSVLDIIPEIKPDSLIVLEISSFQLESFDARKVSPKWAVITNITPDHLNYYPSKKNYIAAKKIIGKYQTKVDFLFIRKNDPIIDSPEFLKGLKAKIIRFSKSDLPKNFKPNLLGNHNLENIAAALAVVQTLEIPKKTSLAAVQNFKGIPFRMELIKVWHGVKIINDTTATSPESGIQAIKTFPGCILICGGMNKEMDYSEYAKTINKFAKKVFLIEGSSTDEIKRYIKNKTDNDLEKLLVDVKPIIKPGDTVLFSPAATSFNLFQNEFDRGRKFNEAVQKVFI